MRLQLADELALVLAVILSSVGWALTWAAIIIVSVCLTAAIVFGLNWEFFFNISFLDEIPHERQTTQT